VRHALRGIWAEAGAACNRSSEGHTRQCVRQAVAVRTPGDLLVLCVRLERPRCSNAVACPRRCANQPSDERCREVRSDERQTWGAARGGAVPAADGRGKIAGGLGGGSLLRRAPSKLNNSMHSQSGDIDRGRARSLSVNMLARPARLGLFLLSS
jgi:hypothetical protein